MKRLYIYLSFILAVFVITAACNDQKSDTDRENQVLIDTSSHGTPKMVFKQDVFDFGTITQGEIITHTFKFTNEGDGNLFIVDVQTSCGCTVPDYSQEPVAPHNEGKIKVKFDSYGKIGMQYKTITVIANGDTANLVVTGLVKEQN